MKMKMKTRLARSFTLIELMTVVAIIAVLAGLVLGGAGAVRQRAARGQAEAEIAAIEAGLVRYQMDFGGYPVPTNNITVDGDVYGATPTAYTSAGRTLFASLWGSSTYSNTTPGRKQYLSVKPSMVSSDGQNRFVDPWGNTYGYYWTGSNSIFGGSVPDIWSTAGQSGSAGQTNRLKWITSWD